MWPSPDQLEKLKELMNSRGFISSFLALIVGWVIYTTMQPITEIPSKLDLIIAKLDHCISMAQLASR